MNNEPLWCGSNVIEGITGDQRQLLPSVLPKHPRIARLDHLGAFHCILKNPGGRFEAEPIPNPNLSK